MVATAESFFLNCLCPCLARFMSRKLSILRYSQRALLLLEKPGITNPCPVPREDVSLGSRVLNWLYLMSLVEHHLGTMLYGLNSSAHSQEEWLRGRVCLCGGGMKTDCAFPRTSGFGTVYIPSGAA